MYSFNTPNNTNSSSDKTQFYCVTSDMVLLSFPRPVCSLKTHILKNQQDSKGCTSDSDMCSHHCITPHSQRQQQEVTIRALITKELGQSMTEKDGIYLQSSSHQSSRKLGLHPIILPTVILFAVGGFLSLG